MEHDERSELPGVGLLVEHLQKDPAGKIVEIENK